MFVRSIFSSYNRLLAGIMLAVLAIALGGCNELAAERVAPSRPVLVATVHYEAESPERSFVGTIKPRIDAGQVVASGQTAIRVARFAEKEAVVAIPETLLGRAKDGVATVTLWSEPNKKYAAKLREIAPAADPATRTYLAKFSLPDAGENVSLGMTATLILADPATERVARLPLSALYSQGGSPSLYIVDGSGDVTLKPVAVKSYESNDVVISGGVEEDAKVVALGVQKLDPTQKVRVVSSLSF